VITAFRPWTLLAAWLLLLLSPLARADSASLLALAQAKDAPRYAAILAKGAEIKNTSDNQSFTVWWQPAGWKPTNGVIVGLHGHDNFATIEAALWQPYAEKHGYAILALQWWFGAGELASDYYRPDQMYPLITTLLAGKGVKPGTVLFTGFSRGSANSYAVAALDNNASGSKYFGLVLSNSGAAEGDYPPNQQIAGGAYGSKPFGGMRWAMYCGEKDPDPTTSGCPGMLASKDWVLRYGATMLLFIDDPSGDHGGFMLNSSNVETALATYANVLANGVSNSEADCLFNWAEDSYATSFVPRRPASQTSAPYYYRRYAASNVYLGVSVADNHAWFVDNTGKSTDLGLATTWSKLAGCR